MPESKQSESLPAAETALVEKPKVSLAQLRENQERRALKAKKRQTKLDNFMLDIKLGAAEDVRLRRFIHMTDAELDAVRPPLTPQERLKVRSWEMPKKAVPYALEASAQFTTSMLRREGEKGGVQLNIGNVEKMVLRLPEKEKETGTPVVIEVVPETK